MDIIVKGKKIDPISSWELRAGLDKNKVFSETPYFTFEGSFDNSFPGTGIKVGEVKPMKFYLDDNSYYESEVRKISEEEGKEIFECVGKLSYHKEKK